MIVHGIRKHDDLLFVSRVAICLVIQRIGRVRQLENFEKVGNFAHVLIKIPLKGILIFYSLNY